MSFTDSLLVLLGQDVSRDPQGQHARLHFFGSIPVDDGTPFSGQSPRANEQTQAVAGAAPRPSVVALVSVNGGVGRSTLATALSSGLQRHGEPVVALDLDPQNALRLHFGVSPTAPGIGVASLQHAQWETLQQPGFAGSRVIPFGDSDTQQQEKLQRWLKDEPDWLAQHLAPLDLSARHTVVIDTPAGNNVYVHQALNVADVVLVIAQADAASLGTLDQLQALLAPHLERERPPQVHFVINQLDEDNAFSLDMVEAFKQRLNKAPWEVHRDMAISEALAFGADPLDSLAAGLASDDINDLCRWLIACRKLR
ncbi:cellulose synthase operon protein YhjQ [Pseudomonas fluorescens]|jgi:cellulose synthase operon protein YhjQ|uniref:cellulose biosynthesis protein BcsQ n=1 Tax=Pseudomonas TaxID=286 RepID=UPI00083E5A97|nr:MULTISPECIES: cellulose biosynthesis protein BcsQ [Pseudomonas]AOE65788.1 cellulose synthase operon protein YhjQ [Pseudomonas fluorescens]AOE71497.1 cellulose synthase operon protein YhjQ [Pseudomonas fluorescens]PMX18473.1 cellulose synthase operon protein YhjQ [Pseudomonas sp. GW460-12]PMX33764.1 cellulose synthase operon protein YhjQ [Pseudomonas sp. MPR-R2A4]PMX36833.1 cellulose synthase operon protein YhjQ [Pseudomonas sp. MPR-R2A7]